MTTTPPPALLASGMASRSDRPAGPLTFRPWCTTPLASPSATVP